VKPFSSGWKSGAARCLYLQTRGLLEDPHEGGSSTRVPGKPLELWYTSTQQYSVTSRKKLISIATML